METLFDPVRQIIHCGPMKLLLGHSNPTSSQLLPKVYPMSSVKKQQLNKIKKCNHKHSK